MALIKCGECGRDVSDKAAACPHCGAPTVAMAAAIKDPRKEVSNWWLIVVIPIGLFALLMIIGSLSGPPDEKSSKRRAISLCWDDQKRKSLSPGTQQFIAGACEKMESDFRQKYGVNP